MINVAESTKTYYFGYNTKLFSLTVILNLLIYSSVLKISFAKFLLTFSFTNTSRQNSTSVRRLIHCFTIYYLLENSIGKLISVPILTIDTKKKK